MHTPEWNISIVLFFSFDRNVNAFILVHFRVLVQSWVWICAPLHKQITGECGGQSAAVCLQGPGVHPGTRVSQVPLQRGAGQVSRGRINQRAPVLMWASGSSWCSSAILHFHHTVCLGSLWPPHQHTKPALSHKDIREVSSSVPGGQTVTPALLPLHPRGLLSVVTVGLFRMLTPDALWAGSALTKVKTRPYATPSPLQSHTRSSCALESES